MDGKRSPRDADADDIKNKPWSRECHLGHQVVLPWHLRAAARNNLDSRCWAAAYRGKADGLKGSLSGLFWQVLFLAACEQRLTLQGGKKAKSWW